MLASTTQRTGAVRTAKPKQPRDEVASNPAPIVVSPHKAPHPHPVYGSVPMGRNGVTLDRQIIQTLDHWHREATALLYENPSTWEHWDVVKEAQGDIYEAALRFKPERGDQAARQFEIVLRQAQYDECVTVFSVEEFERLVKGLVVATGPISPKKMVGATSRGRKLTTAGLLIRYQNFLVQELETLSWQLYGESEFAQQFRINDDAVNARCKRLGDPLFDQKTLPNRARSVLKSLKIDTENVVKRPPRGGTS